MEPFQLLLLLRRVLQRGEECGRTRSYNCHTHMHTHTHTCDEREGVPPIIFTTVCGRSRGRKTDRLTFTCVTGNNPSGARLAIRVLQTTSICCFMGHCLGMKLVRMAHTRRSQEQQGGRAGKVGGREGGKRRGEVYGRVLARFLSLSLSVRMRGI